MSDIPTTSETGERADLLEKIAQARFFLRLTAEGLSDEQAALHPTASALSVGGLIKHVANVEERWADFIVRGAAAMSFHPDAMADHAATFAMLPGEALAGLLEQYADVARRTDALLVDLPDLDVSHALPEAPWFPPGAKWSARRVLLHIIAETAQHSGHADILRETIDGSKSMG